MVVTIEIAEKELKEAMLKAMVNEYYQRYSSDRNHFDRVIKDCIREIVYKDKERITELIVSRASRHLKNVAAKKMVESMMEDGDE